MIGENAKDTTATSGTAVLLELSNAIVRLHKECAGKGPVKARAHLVGDLAVCVLEGGMTRDEQTLMENGQAEAVLAKRRALLKAMDERAVAIVERTVGRRVRSHLSTTDPECDVCVEVFVLEPRTGDGNGDGRVIRADGPPA